MRFVSLVSAALSLAFLAAAPVATMAQERMRPVGSVTYDPLPAEPQIGTFNIRPDDRRIRNFRIEASRGGAEVRFVTIIYSDGDRERVRIAQNLSDGQRTGLIRVSKPRPVRAVDINYVPRGFVRLVMQADAGGPPPPPPARWTELGCKSVGFLADKDKMFVNSTERFRALRLRSTGYDIEMLQMVVRYANGSNDTFVVRQLIPSGTVTRAIDLRGERRRINQIDFLYRATAVGMAKTRLCVEGLSEPDPRSMDGEFIDDTESVQ